MIRPGIRRLFRLAVRRADATAAEMDDEIRLHLALRAEQLVGEGRSPAAARLEAEARFGLHDDARRRLHDSARRREASMSRVERFDALRQDVRYAWRGLRRNPAFAVVAALTLALGIGANTAIFSVVNAVMLRSLPVRRPEQLAQITLGGGRDEELSNPIFEALRDRALRDGGEVFSGVFAFAPRRFDLARGGETRPVEGAWATGAFFDVLGVGPTIGRVLHAGDDVRGCAAVAVLGFRFWQSAYGGDPSVVGRTLPLDGHPFEIVGVAAPTFAGVEVGRPVQVYAPLCAKAVVDGGDGGLDDSHQWFLRVVGRARDGLALADVRARVQALAPAVFAATVSPDAGADERRDYLTNRLDAVPAATGHSAMRLEYGAALVALMVVVGVVLLVACANVANLLLARAAARRREIAIRLSVGAGRARLVRQLFTESLLLAALGAGAGLLFARWAGAALVGLLARQDAGVSLDLALDGRVLAFTLAVTALTAVLFGLAPAWRATRVDLQATMKAGGGDASEGRAGSRFAGSRFAGSRLAGSRFAGSRFAAGKALVVAQIALSLVLVLGAGLLLGTFRTLLTLDPGFRREGVLLVAVDMRDAGYAAARLPFARQALLDRLRLVPGVRSASASVMTPVSGAGWAGPVSVDGFTPADKRDALVFFNAVSDGFFATLGTRLVAGRDFGPRDVGGAPPVAVVNETTARRFFGGADPIGRQIGVHNGPGAEQRLEIVGVVRDAKYGSLREDARAVVYLPLAQDPHPEPSVNVELRASGAATALVPAITAAAAEVHPRFSLAYRTLADQVDASLGRERLLATLSGFFGALALLLAVVGLYGTMSYTLARRRRELGVRVALGAARGRLMRQVLGEVARLVAAGLALGGVAGAVTARWVAPFLFGRSPVDPATWALSAATLAAAALAAGALPAWRAATADPVRAIRTE